VTVYKEEYHKMCLAITHPMTAANIQLWISL